MPKELTHESIQTIVTNSNVFYHLINLQKELKKSYDINPNSEKELIAEAIQESPITNEWIKNIVIPQIHSGDEGLEKILLEIENEKNLLLGATRLQIVLDMLKTFEEPLKDIQQGVEEGEYDITEGIRLFEEEALFKTLH